MSDHTNEGRATRGVLDACLACGRACRHGTVHTCDPHDVATLTAYAEKIAQALEEHGGFPAGLNLPADAW